MVEAGMTRESPELQAWWRRTIIAPPKTRDEWVRLVTWELWIGLILFFLLAVGIELVITPPDGGWFTDTFSVTLGVTMLAVAARLLWSLWSAAEPAPITDDFLSLLHESYGRNWRDPRTWPWSRLKWAYGFTTVGVAMGLLLTIALSEAIRSLPSTRRPATRMDTLQIFRVP
jgi:hypothetical protein